MDVRVWVAGPVVVVVAWLRKGGGWGTGGGILERGSSGFRWGTRCPGEQMGGVYG